MPRDPFTYSHEEQYRGAYALDPGRSAPRIPGRAAATRQRDISAKRVFDIVVALAVIALAAPLLAVIALLIVCESGFPILFCQKRAGMNGEHFTIFKFRTMTQGGPDTRQAVRDDPRVTRLGSFLRRSSLDELPQIFNVLLGTMSIVGPRPHPLWLDERFDPVIPNYRGRLAMRPGITGLAQISGARGETRTAQDMARRVRFDLHYVENWSLLLDLEIVAKTAFYAWSDDRAY